MNLLSTTTHALHPFRIGHSMNAYRMEIMNTTQNRLPNDSNMVFCSPKIG